MTRAPLHRCTGSCSGWRLCASTPFDFPLIDKAKLLLQVFNHGGRHRHKVFVFDLTHIPECTWTETEGGSTVPSVVSHYRDAWSFYSISPIMAMHPLLKSICFYLMYQLFPRCFVLYSKYKSLPLHSSLPPPSSRG